MTLPRPEWLVIAVNSVILTMYLFERPLQPGKLLYWGGGIIIMVGMLKMKG